MNWIKNNWIYITIALLMSYIMISTVTHEKNSKSLLNQVETLSEVRYQDSLSILELERDIFVCDSLINIDKGEITRELKDHSNKISSMLKRWRDSDSPDVPELPVDPDSLDALFLKLIGEI